MSVIFQVNTDLELEAGFHGGLINFKVATTLLSSAAAAAAKSLQSCLTLCHPIDGSPPGSSVPEKEEK